MASSNTNEVATVSEEKALVLSKVQNLIDPIPLAGGDGSAFIVRVLEAQTAEDLVGDDSTEADDVEAMFDHMIRVDSIQRWTSDFTNTEAVTDQYMIVHGYDLDENRDVVFAIGAATPIVKLAKLHSFMAFPAVVRFNRSNKATAQGYYPINMSVISVTAPETVNA